MTRKHNTRHQRNLSRYKERLRTRGLKGAPRLEDVDVLRTRQDRQVLADQFNGEQHDDSHIEQ
jgi:hypothetical protein